MQVYYIYFSIWRLAFLTFLSLEASYKTIDALSPVVKVLTPKSPPLVHRNQYICQNIQSMFR